MDNSVEKAVEFFKEKFSEDMGFYVTDDNGGWVQCSERGYNDEEESFEVIFKNPELDLAILVSIPMDFEIYDNLEKQKLMDIIEVSEVHTLKNIISYEAL